MDMAITKMSSKGQVVIPQEMRRDIKEGDKLVIIQSGDQIIMKKVTKMQKQLEEDLEFAKKTKEAWESYDRGEFKRVHFDEFIEELKKC